MLLYHSSWRLPRLTFHTLQWGNEPTHDYHPALARTDEESIEAKLGDCSICIEPISSDQGHLAPNRPLILQLCWTQVTKKRRVYALAPCGHNFVSWTWSTNSSALISESSIPAASSNGWTSRVYVHSAVHHCRLCRIV